jgi:hypothetical protein
MTAARVQSLQGARILVAEDDALLATGALSVRGVFGCDATTCRSVHRLVCPIRPANASQDVHACLIGDAPGDASGMRIRIDFRPVRGVHRRLPVAFALPIAASMAPP